MHARMTRPPANCNNKKISTHYGCQAQGLLWQICAAVADIEYYLHQCIAYMGPNTLDEHEQAPVSFAHAMGQVFERVAYALRAILL